MLEEDYDRAEMPLRQAARENWVKAILKVKEQGYTTGLTFSS